MQFENLFTPIQIGTKTARNRIVFPAHGVNLPFAGDAFDGEGYIAYQAARARGGSAVNIFGPCVCHRSSMRLGSPPFNPPTPSILIPKLHKMADALHEYGTLAIMQFLYFGNSYTSAPGNALWGFSQQAAREERREVCHEMDEDEINEILDSFAEYAAVSREGGLDGIEIHACHGDLVQQSWSNWGNRRTDKWGDPLAFSKEILRRVREAVGRDFIISFRITADDFLPGGMDIEANQKIVQALEATGEVDLFNVSFGNGGASYAYAVGSMYIPPASLSVPLTSGIKQVIRSTPVIAVSRINDPALAEGAIADGHADMVGLVRGQIADPEFGNKAREGRVEDIRLCIGCNQGCWDGGVGDLNCTQNVTAGREAGIYGSLKPASVKKSVLVIGGGPAGMEAARVAAVRGHEVILYEKSAELGGQINILSLAPGREEFRQVVRYLSTQLQKLGVKIKLNSEATLETVQTLQPQVVLAATGSQPFIEPVPGAGQKNVVTPVQILTRAVEAGQKVVVYDATGLQEAPSVADYLALSGRQVEIVTAFATIGAWWGLPIMGIGTHVPVIWSRLKKNGVVITPFSRVEEINGSTLSIADVWTGETHRIEEVDTVVMATGYRSEDRLFRALKGAVPELQAIGDCYAPKRALDAIHDGFYKAFYI